jgi:hypothetical protein
MSLSASSSPENPSIQHSMALDPDNSIYGGTVVGRQSLADEDAWPGHGVGKGGFGAPIANGHPRSAGMTLPIANGLAGSAGQPLPEDAVCDWKGPIKGPFAIGRDSRPTRESPYSRYENAPKPTATTYISEKALGSANPILLSLASSSEHPSQAPVNIRKRRLITSEIIQQEQP